MLHAGFTVDLGPTDNGVAAAAAELVRCICMVYLPARLHVCFCDKPQFGLGMCYVFFSDSLIFMSPETFGAGDILFLSMPVHA